MAECQQRSLTPKVVAGNGHRKLTVVLSISLKTIDKSKFATRLFMMDPR